MEDKQIIDLYWERAEDAIRETSAKYGRLCQYIAQNILSSPEDSEECVNDTWLGLWNAIPPQRPNHFSAFIGKIVRSKVCKQVAVKRAVIAHVVYAVQNADKLELVISDNPVKPVREIGVLDFLRVSGAYRREFFATFDCALHKVNGIFIFDKISVLAEDIEQIAQQIE